MKVKTALITGASSGIGKETAYEYAIKGYNMVLVARRTENLEAIKKEIEAAHKNRVDIISLDLAKLKSAEELFQTVKDKNLQIDVLINNAGFGIYSDLIDNEAEKLEGMLVLNMITLSKLTQLFAKEMVKMGGGHIINIASTAAFQPVPGLAAYSATKSYVMNFSEAVAFELKDKNVKVISVSPGATQSEFGVVAGFGEVNPSSNKMATSTNLAQFIYESMIKNKTNAIHGFKNSFFVLFNRIFSRKMATNIASLMMKK